MEKNKVQKFKCIGGIITPTASEKEGMKRRLQKMEIAYHLTANIYKKQSVSRKAKLRHYKTVTCPEALHACERFGLFSAENIFNVKRKILKKNITGNK